MTFSGFEIQMLLYFKIPQKLNQIFNALQSIFLPSLIKDMKGTVRRDYFKFGNLYFFSKLFSQLHCKGTFYASN